MRTTLCLGWLAIVVLCLGIAPAGAALVNPSFEDPSAEGGDLNQAPTGWTVTTSAVWITRYVTPPDGDQYVELGNGTSLYQFSDIVSQEGTSYTASVYGRCDRTGISGNNVFLTVIVGTGISDYNVVAQTAAHSETDWVLMTTSFTCSAEDAGKNIAVYLNGGAGSWCWQGYDMATLTPEPATMGLLVVGGLGVLFRRKR